MQKRKLKRVKQTNETKLSKNIDEQAKVNSKSLKNKDVRMDENAKQKTETKKRCSFELLHSLSLLVRVLSSQICLFSFLVIVPTGIRVIVERNYWGIDVTIYTPRAKYSQDEEGLCTYSGNDGDITHLAWKHRCVLMTNRNG